MPRKRRSNTSVKAARAEAYQHPEADLAARPEVGAQAHFKKSKPAAKYRFDSALAPELVWDGENPGREEVEAIIAEATQQNDVLRQQLAAIRKLKTDVLSSEQRTAIAESIAALEKAIAGNHDALTRLRRMSEPFLNWAGKAERLSFEVPTLPLFVHERLSTTAIIETLRGHKRDKQESFLDSLFGSEERSLVEQTLRAYEHRDRWVNRLVLGDSLVVMNSLLRYESLGGQVQMIYVDPPYGVKFGSNFQPFIRRRDVKHNEDDDFTREPEMVQAYRDTWELGLHSYLTYLRDRLLVARDLLAPTGSIFVQISDENLHHVREVMDEVFGAENSVSLIAFRTSSPLGASGLPGVCDYLLWYARDTERMKFRQIFATKEVGEGTEYVWLEEKDGTRRRMTPEERQKPSGIPGDVKVFSRGDLHSTGYTPTCTYDFEFQGQRWTTSKKSWRTHKEGMAKLIASNRLTIIGEAPYYVQYHSDFPLQPLNNLWADTRAALAKRYVVETQYLVIQRCMMMTTDPGDLVLDPTCGSGTTAFVAEQWGRRWITCDTSRVPLALARQRLLTATFDYYALKDDARGPAGGFVYQRRQNQKGEEVGGIVPHITLKSIANNEPPAEEVLVDRPEVTRGVVRVCGPFTLEATIPTAEGLDEEPETPGIQSETYQSYVNRMLEVLRRAPVLRLPGNQTITLKHIRPPAKTLTLSAEALVEEGGERSTSNVQRATSNEASAPGAGGDQSAIRNPQSAIPVAILFGPENGPIGERLVREAWDEAGLKRYTHLYVIGFAIDPKARQFIESAGKIGLACTYLQATMDLQMGDLLKNMRSSQIFSVCGLPDVRVARASNPKSKPPSGGTPEPLWEVELLGLDTFDPVTMEADHLKSSEVPAWLLDTDYNGMVFRVRQAFFPKTGAWENLKKALRMEFEETVWDHLAGTVSAPFERGDHGQIAVKVIDPRGNELLVVKKIEG